MSDRCDWLPRSCWLLAWLASPLVACAADPAPGDLDFFESRIRPVLVAHCYECHGPEKEVKGGLRLDTRQGWQTGGDSGPAILPGKPDDSLLLQALRYDPNFVEMPPRGKLPENVIRDFETWIAKGAADPREADPASPAPVATTARSAAEHWAYHPIQKRPAPPVRNEAWARDEIDRFILARLEAAGLEPALDAKPEVLARRLSFDLVGLPPTPEQIDALAAGD
ncbi:MAG: DUF1549 domain-containing protein, partial [Planctomycetaceae bacterium]|nr:DUF1549 domain-containing protein [Planctomycetaceae bacterium]